MKRRTCIALECVFLLVLSASVAFGAGGTRVPDGNMTIENGYLDLSTGKGVIFPDGKVQSSASTGSGVISVTGADPISNTGSATNPLISLTGVIPDSNLSNNVCTLNSNQIMSGAKIFSLPIAVGLSVPDTSAALDLQSTTKGMLIPRVTSAQRVAIASPANGLIVYDTDHKTIYYYEATDKGWVGLVTDAAVTAYSPLAIASNPDGSRIISMLDSGVTANTYTFATITVDSKGRITAASNGNAVDLASSAVTGTLPVTKGGTGATILTGYVKGSGTANLSASPSIPVADIAGLNAVATSGNYSDLSNKPIAGTDYLAPTGNGSQLTGLNKGQVSLGNVDNTTDAGKPISNATQAALDAKANSLDIITALSGKVDTSTTVNGHALVGNVSVNKNDIGLGNVEDLKVSLTAEVAPTVSNDSGQGYSVGSRWVDTVAKKEYVCTDASIGAAAWKETTVATTGLLAASNNLSELPDKAAARTNLGITTDAQTLQGHPATDFLGANAQATDAAKLGGVAAAQYALTANISTNAQTLQSHPASDFQLAGAAVLLPSTRPSSPVAGTVVYNTALKSPEYWDGSVWQPVVRRPLGASCKEIVISGQSTGDGLYWIQPRTNGPVVQVYCDMSTDGGGYTLVSYGYRASTIMNGSSYFIPTEFRGTYLGSLRDAAASIDGTELLKGATKAAITVTNGGSAVTGNMKCYAIAYAWPLPTGTTQVFDLSDAGTSCATVTVTNLISSATFSAFTLSNRPQVSCASSKAGTQYERQFLGFNANGCYGVCGSDPINSMGMVVWYGSGYSPTTSGGLGPPERAGSFAFWLR